MSNTTHRLIAAMQAVGNHGADRIADSILKGRSPLPLPSARSAVHPVSVRDLHGMVGRADTTTWMNFEFVDIILVFIIVFFVLYLWKLWKTRKQNTHQ